MNQGEPSVDDGRGLAVFSVVTSASPASRTRIEAATSEGVQPPKTLTDGCMPARERIPLVFHRSLPAAVCKEAASCEWIADIGCGLHLVSLADVSQKNLVTVRPEEAKTLYTANGPIVANQRVSFDLPELGLRGLQATVLPETPKVLTIGGLTMDAGCHFIWRANRNPVIILPTGQKIECEVHGRIPYVRTGMPALPAVEKDGAAPESRPAALDVVPALPPGESPPFLLPAGLPPADAIAEIAEVDDRLDESSEVDGPAIGADDVNKHDWKAEALSLEHLLTHTPKNPYCDVCQRAKVQRVQCRRHRLRGPAPENFGEQCTADHVVAYSERSQGITGDRSALVIGDRATGWFQGMPITGKGTADTHEALLAFADAYGRATPLS